METSNANAICATCGTTNQNDENACCINDHDDWLELRDEAEIFSRASKNLNATTEELIYAIKNNIDIKK